MDDADDISSAVDSEVIADTAASCTHQTQEPLMVAETNRTDVRSTEVGGEMEVGCTTDTNVFIVKQTENAYLSTCRVYRNLISLGLSFTLLFTAFLSLASLQSTINSSDGLGTFCLATVYLSMVLTSLFLPTLTIWKLGSKRTMTIAMVTYLGYIAADFHASWATKVPTSILLGVGAAHLWTAQAVFVAELAKHRAITTGQQQDHVTGNFFGIFFAIYVTGIVWGNLISSLVLRKSSTADDLDNSSVLTSFDQCGAEFCPMSEATNLAPTDSGKLDIYVGFCLGCGVVAVVILTTLDSIKSPQPTGEPRKIVTGIVRHIWNSTYQKLLIPCTICRGLSSAFIQSELTAAFTSCMFGVQNVGFVMICFGGTSAIVSFITGKLSKYTGHFILFATAFTIQIAVSLILLLYTFEEDQLYVMFILSAVFGIGNAVPHTNTIALYSRFFKNDSTNAFASFLVFDSIGWGVAFAYSAKLCIRVKIYILISVLLASLCCLAILELLDRQSKHKNIQELEMRPVVTRMPPLAAKENEGLSRASH